MKIYVVASKKFFGKDKTDPEAGVYGSFFSKQDAEETLQKLKKPDFEIFTFEHTEMTHTEIGYAKPVAEKTFLVTSESHCFWGSPMITVLPKLDDPTDIYDVPNVLEYNGVRYGKTGFNSDTGRVFYSVRQYKKLAKLP